MFKTVVVNIELVREALVLEREFQETEGFQRLLEGCRHDIDDRAGFPLDNGDSQSQRRDVRSLSVLPGNFYHRLFEPALLRAGIPKAEQVVRAEDLPRLQPERLSHQRRTVKRLPLPVHEQSLHDRARSVRLLGPELQILPIQIVHEPLTRIHNIFTDDDLSGYDILRILNCPLRVSFCFHVLYAKFCQCFLQRL